MFAIFCIFCFGIKDMDDWEKEINSLKCVESVEVEKIYPDDDESTEYNLKIFLTEGRYLQIMYFTPYCSGGNQFCIERIGNIIPAAWGYWPYGESSYELDYDFFRFKYLAFFNKKQKGIISLINNYDEIFDFINTFPCYPLEYPYEIVERTADKKEKPVSASWEKYPSPYIYTKYNKLRERWEEFKLYKMTVEEYNDYMISRGWESRVIEENP